MPLLVTLLLFAFPIQWPTIRNTSELVENNPLPTQWAQQQPLRICGFNFSFCKFDEVVTVKQPNDFSK